MIAAYLRVSTEDQAERGTIENQREFTLKYCDLHQLGVPDLYVDDGITGTIPLDERPEGKRLLRDAALGLFDTLLVYKLDRLGRSARITLNAVHALEELGLVVRSMTEPFDTKDASGRFLLTILAGVADLERSNILDRMWFGAQRCAAAGQWMGGIVPYGYKKTGKYLEIDEQEAAVVRMMYSKLADDAWNCIKLSDHMNALRIPTAYASGHGKRAKGVEGVWRPARVRNLLINEIYKGIHYYGKRTDKKRELIPRPMPAIVTEDVWERTQLQLHKNRVIVPGNAKTQFLLRGLIKCECGLNYSGVTYKGRTRNFYRCNGKTRNRGQDEICQSLNIPADHIETKVWNRIVQFVTNPGKELEALRNNVESESRRVAELEKEKKALQSAIDGKAKEREIIIDMTRKGIITQGEATIQLDKLAIEKEALRKQAEEIAQKIHSSHASSEDFDSIRAELEQMRGNIENATYDTKRKIVQKLVSGINVTKRGSEAHFEVVYKFVAHIHTDRDSLTRSTLSVMDRYRMN